MAAYFIAQLEITDPAGFDEYRKLVAPLVAKYGGKYVVRGGAIEPIEGDWAPKRLVILEFESVERVKQWHDSEDYRPVMAMRQGMCLRPCVKVSCNWRHICLRTAVMPGRIRLYMNPGPQACGGRLS